MKMNYFKKWVFAAALALGVLGAGARVTEGTEYFLHLDGSDLYLSAETAKAGSNSELSLNNVLSEGYAQAFVFTAAEGGYNVTVGGAFTVVRDQWYMHYKNTSEVTLTGNDAIFAVEESGNGIRLKNLGTGKYVGADSRNDGSHVYSDKTDDAVIDPALDALQKAMDDYLKSMPNPCADGGTFRFRHVLSGCTLSSGWFEEKECILITDNGASDYNQDFTFVEAPGVDKSKGMNIRTADGKYVYRDSWNLYVTDNTDQLAQNNYLFKVETADGYLIIKNLGSNKYFGTDNNAAWSHVYSDKPGAGARSNYFELIKPNGIGDIAADGSDEQITGVYNLQGIRVADTPDRLPARGVYIVLRGRHAEKIIR